MTTQTTTEILDIRPVIDESVYSPHTRELKTFIEKLTSALNTVNEGRKLDANTPALSAPSQEEHKFLVNWLNDNIAKARKAMSSVLADDFFTHLDGRRDYGKAIGE